MSFTNTVKARRTLPAQLSHQTAYYLHVQESPGPRGFTTCFDSLHAKAFGEGVNMGDVFILLFSFRQKYSLFWSLWCHSENQAHVQEYMTYLPALSFAACVFGAGSKLSLSCPHDFLYHRSQMENGQLQHFLNYFLQPAFVINPCASSQILSLQLHSFLLQGLFLSGWCVLKFQQRTCMILLLNHRSQTTLLVFLGRCTIMIGVMM